MAKQKWKPGNMVYPLPAVLVSCGDKKGNINVMTAAWTGTICSDPPWSMYPFARSVIPTI